MGDLTRGFNKQNLIQQMSVVAAQTFNLAGAISLFLLNMQIIIHS